MKYIERLLNYLLRDNRLFPGRGLKQKLYNMIFGAETFTGKAFDIILMASILLSVLFTIFESMMMSDSLLRLILFYSEWFFIVFFTFEYIARVYCAPNRKEYILSFFGIIDLLSILPFYTSFFFHGAHYLPVLRVFRLIRVFRVFKLFNYLEEGNLILVALHKSM
ncbi:MAG: ion transporter, partial [Bacteroidaceae bacterium]|nr:ion transporter [Bacteroidaceae bacterium]